MKQSKPKIRVLYLYDKDSPNEVDFIFEDGSFCYTYLSDDDTIRVMHYSDRIDEQTDLSNLCDALQGSPAQMSIFDGIEDVKRKKVDKYVLYDVLTWHYTILDRVASVKDFDLIKMEKSNNNEKNADLIKGFLMLCGGFDFKEKELCNEIKN